MIEPITLTEFGERLNGYPDSSYGDEGKMSTCIGWHDVCKGWVDIRDISETHRAIVCRRCNLRVIVPNTVETFGDLRKHLKKWQ